MEGVSAAEAGSGERVYKRPKKGDKNYYQNFDFFFKRSCFRTMALYYKLAYKPFFDKWKAGKNKSSVFEESLIAFVQLEFPGLLDKLGEDSARFEFIELVKLLVLAHRHNKNDEFLRDPLVDFATVREPLYKYSKQAQDRFFSHTTFAFLFAWFAVNPNSKAFAAEKFAENSDERHTVRMQTEVQLLLNEATANLAKLSQHSSERINSSKRVYIQGQTGMAEQLNSYIAAALQA